MTERATPSPLPRPRLLGVSDWPSGPLAPGSPAFMHEGIPQLRDLYPELAEWPDAALAEAWMHFCVDARWAQWVDVVDTPHFVGYLALRAENALPADPSTLFYEPQLLEWAAAMWYGVDTAALCAAWVRRREVSGG